jgi:XTP/dITP diphosphohydrolase
VIIATRNAKKLSEIQDLLAPWKIEVRAVSDFADVPEVEETGTTFAENAALKATQIALHLGDWCLGEDSGLMVDALGGQPGVYSARYSGPDATDASNNAKLIAALVGVPTAKRSARYVCHVAVSDPTGVVRVSVEATCRGRIIDEARGTNGFGYDPHFLVPEYHRTFGELSPLVKRCLSHRARAFTRAIPLIIRLLGAS